MISRRFSAALSRRLYTGRIRMVVSVEREGERYRERRYGHVGRDALRRCDAAEAEAELDVRSAVPPEHARGPELRRVRAASGSETLS